MQCSDLLEQRASRAEVRHSSLPPGGEISLRRALGSNQSFQVRVKTDISLKKKKVKVKVLNCSLVNLVSPVWR